MPDIHVAWWNVENLFDHERAVRDPKLARTLKGELKGWTAAVRDRKLDQLASIVMHMCEGKGPDLLGIGEVEHEGLLRMLIDRLDLPERSYQVLGHDSPDARGIDVSFIFDANVLTASDANHQVVVKRTPTRDLFWAMFTVQATGEPFVAIANHWPARSAGQYASEPFRMMTGETVSVVLDELLEDDANFPVLLMGDFNDEPFDRSMQEYLLGSRDRGQVTRARTPRVWNLMWTLFSQNNPGSYRYGTDWNMLDQFLVTKGLVKQSGSLVARPETVDIFRPSAMLERADAPRRFGRPSKKGFDRDGFSDHFPITMVLRAT